MKPGRDLDALIAKRVLGLPDVRYQDQGWRAALVFGPNIMAEVAALVPHYSIDIAAAWEVVEFLTKDSARWFDVTRYQKTVGIDGPPYEQFWRATFGSASMEGISEISAPHAICLAALKAVGVEV